MTTARHRLPRLALLPRRPRRRRHRGRGARARAAAHGHRPARAAGRAALGAVRGRLSRTTSSSSRPGSTTGAPRGHQRWQASRRPPRPARGPDAPAGVVGEAEGRSATSRRRCRACDQTRWYSHTNGIETSARLRAQVAVADQRRARGTAARRSWRATAPRAVTLKSGRRPDPPAAQQQAERHRRRRRRAVEAADVPSRRGW